MKSTVGPFCPILSSTWLGWLAAAGLLTIADPAANAQGAATDKVRFYFNVTIGADVGVVDLELYGNESPLHVANFLDYVDDGEYDNSYVHRTRARNPGQPLGFDLFAQGGSFKVPTDGILSSNPIAPRAPVPNEFDPLNGLSNTPGSISAARTADPDSATSGWFINQSDNSGSFDPGPYTVFGQVTHGMELIDNIPFLPNLPSLAGTAFESTPFVNSNLLVIQRAQRVGIIDGDYNLDGTIDRADYEVWKQAFGTALTDGDAFASAADGNRDGVINSADYTVWRVSLVGAVGSISKGAAIPEPTTITGLVCAALLSLLARVPVRYLAIS